MKDKFDEKKRKIKTKVKSKIQQIKNKVQDVDVNPVVRLKKALDIKKK